MEQITLHAHFDGTRIQLDKPFDLQPNTKLLVTVIQVPETEDDAWAALSTQGLATAYDDDELEYSFSHMKEHNPDYERKRVILFSRRCRKRMGKSKIVRLSFCGRCRPLTMPWFVESARNYINSSRF